MCHTLLINREGQRESSLYSHCQSLTQNLCSATEAVPVLGPHVSLQQPGEAEVWALLKKQSYALLPLSFFALEKKSVFFFFFPLVQSILGAHLYICTRKPTSILWAALCMVS